LSKYLRKPLLLVDACTCQGELAETTKKVFGNHQLNYHVFIIVYPQPQTLSASVIKLLGCASEFEGIGRGGEGKKGE
jgi:hypothetical protein